MDKSFVLCNIYDTYSLCDLVKWSDSVEMQGNVVWTRDFRPYYNIVSEAGLFLKVADFHLSGRYVHIQLSAESTSVGFKAGTSLNVPSDIVNGRNDPI